MSKPIIGIGSDVAVQPGQRDRAFVYTTYVEALKRAGAIPLLVPPQPENAADLLDGLDGLLLAGGDDCDPAAYGEERHPSVDPVMDPRRQNNDLALARMARDRGVPTLGICLGVQVMNVAAGGTLIQDIESTMQTDIDHASNPNDRHRHEVTIESNTHLSGILGATNFNVNSSHHQAIKGLGHGLRVTAKAPDGIIEGLEDPSLPFYLGVQWHPEDMAGETSASDLFGALVEAARKYSQTKGKASTEMSPVVAGLSE
ncbi:MAG: gamma-glutamyl-gamma-aminobutyrate hydrolase family protein [Thermoanaerobaculia bacterium]